MNMNRIRFSSVLAVAIILGIGVWTPRILAQQSTRSGDELEVLQLRPDVYMIAGAGGNIAVQIGTIGVILVDTGSAQEADTVLAAVSERLAREGRLERSAVPRHEIVERPASSQLQTPN